MVFNFDVRAIWRSGLFVIWDEVPEGSTLFSEVQEFPYNTATLSPRHFESQKRFALSSSSMQYERVTYRRKDKEQVVQRIANKSHGKN